MTPSRAEITSPAITDEELIRGIVAGCQESLDILHARYRFFLQGIIMQTLHSEADAEEALQNTFLSIWTQADRFDASKGKALGWVVCVARRRAIDHWRKVRRHDGMEIKLSDHGRHENDLADADFSREPGGVAKAIANELCVLLTAKMDNLPPEQSRVIELIFFKQMSQRQVAAHLGVPLGTVKTRVHLGISKLSRELMPLRPELG